jgi:hypothetical protein
MKPETKTKIIQTARQVLRGAAILTLHVAGEIRKEQERRELMMLHAGEEQRRREFDRWMNEREWKKSRGL